MKDTEIAASARREGNRLDKVTYASKVKYANVCGLRQYIIITTDMKDNDVQGFNYYVDDDGIIQIIFQPEKLIVGVDMSLKEKDILYDSRKVIN